MNNFHKNTDNYKSLTVFDRTKRYCTVGYETPYEDPYRLWKALLEPFHISFQSNSKSF